MEKASTILDHGKRIANGQKENVTGSLEKKYYVSGNAILKQTVNPEPGYATQEVFFTCKANNLYAILTNYPDKITLKDVKSTSHTIINLLGYPDKLRWEQKRTKSYRIFASNNIFEDAM